MTVPCYQALSTYIHHRDTTTMVRINTLDISPPLLNASCAWASELSQLRELYDCPYTGAVTTRTATLNGFNEDATNTVRVSPNSMCS